MCSAVFGIEKILIGLTTRRTSPGTTFLLVCARDFTRLPSALACNSPTNSPEVQMCFSSGASFALA
jgi:hypothetical protein